MVLFAVELHQRRVEVLAHVGHDPMASVEYWAGESATAIFGDKYQMHMEIPNCASPSANIDIFFPSWCHRPMVHCP